MIFNKKSKKSNNVLIVEDNLFMAELLAERISHRDYETTIASNGKEALDKIKKDKPSLVLLDLPLSGDVKGLKVIEKIRSTYDKKALPIIALFNARDEKGIKDGVDKGINVSHKTRFKY